jgi:hypothetical protein
MASDVYLSQNPPCQSFGAFLIAQRCPEKRLQHNGSCTKRCGAPHSENRPRDATGFRFPILILRSATSGSRDRAACVPRPVWLEPRGGPGIGVGVADGLAHRGRCTVRPSVLVLLRGRGDLDHRGSKQGGAKNRQDCLSHRRSPLFRRFVARQGVPRASACPHITIRVGHYYAASHHEAGSKILNQKISRLNIQQAEGCTAFRLGPPSLWTSFGRSASMEANGAYPVREADEEADICNPLDLIPCVGANEIGPQERGRTCRQLCADWSDGRRQTGLFDEMR